MTSKVDQIFRAYWLPIVAVLALVALSLFFLPHRPSSPSSVRFFMLEGGIPEWYELSGTALSRAPAPQSNLVVANHEGMIVTMKIRAASSTPELWAISSTSSSVNLGKGFAAAFTDSGDLIVIAPNGLVRIDPQSAVSHQLLSNPSLSPGLSALAPDGRAAALENSVTESIDVFSIGAGGKSTAYVGSVLAVPLSVAFAGPDTFVVHDANGYEAFTIERSVISKPTALTLQ